MKNNRMPGVRAMLASICLLTVNSRAQEIALPPVHQVASMVDEAEGSVIINGFEVLQMPSSANQQNTTKVVSQYLRKGLNTFEFRYKPLDPPGDELPDPARAVALTLIRHASLQDAGEEGVQALEIERFENADAAETNVKTLVRVGGSEMYSLNQRGLVDLTKLTLRPDLPFFAVEPREGTDSSILVELDIPDAGLVALPWDGAPPELTEQDKILLQAKVIELHAAYSARQLATVATLLDAKYVRSATALGKTKSEVVADEIALLSALIGDPGFVFDPIAVENLEFVVHPSLNLVSVKRNGTSPIRGSAEGVEFTMDVYFSKIQGQWVLVE